MFEVGVQELVLLFCETCRHTMRSFQPLLPLVASPLPVLSHPNTHTLPDPNQQLPLACFVMLRPSLTRISFPSHFSSAASPPAADPSGGPRLHPPPPSRRLPPPRRAPPNPHRHGPRRARARGAAGAARAPRGAAAIGAWAAAAVEPARRCILQARMGDARACSGRRYCFCRRCRRHDASRAGLGVCGKR